MSIEKLNLKTGDLVTESHFNIIDNNFQDYKDNKTEILNTLDSHTSQLNVNTQSIENINTDVKNNKIKNIDISEFSTRKSNPRVFEKFELQSEFGYYPANIFSDGYNFYTDLDIKSYKNNSSHTYYISPEGDNTKDGLSKENAFKTFFKAYSTATEGDTIVFCNGNYDKRDISNDYIEKSLNLIAEEAGKVNVFSSYKQTYVQYNSTNVYKTDLYTISKIIDISNIEKTLELIKVDTLEECINQQGTWYYENNKTAYIHMFCDKVVTSDNVALLVSDKAIIYTQSTSSNVELYIEGINFYGGVNHGNLNFENSSSFKNSKLYLNECGFYYGGGEYSGTKYSSVYVRGANSIFKNCICMYGYRDGFAYLDNNGTSCNSIEIDCIGANCGLDNDDGSNNGSTIHGNCRIVRINTKAYNCTGGVIADANNSRSLNLGCEAWDSCTNNEALNSNYCPYDTAEMYLYACKSFGSKLGINRNAIDTKVYIKNSCYENIVGSGVTIFLD